MKKKHDIKEVLDSLSKKRDIRIEGYLIKILKDKVYNKRTDSVERNPAKRFDLGNGSWGKIDYLTGQGFRTIYVSHF